MPNDFRCQDNDLWFYPKILKFGRECGFWWKFVKMPNFGRKRSKISFLVENVNFILNSKF